ncbi:hypothetical protein EYF80_040615 [Liparis tanakae]|uniref:Uncharacterized protein n=1 Tax=Liparis tanakae TaxID=230148 RepID=A0A4Z2G6K4_9TELE|nr:hypothetical protein EYF80_040615 [Liparis tanakae]
MMLISRPGGEQQNVPEQSLEGRWSSVCLAAATGDGRRSVGRLRLAEMDVSVTPSPKYSLDRAGESQILLLELRRRRKQMDKDNKEMGKNRIRVGRKIVRTGSLTGADGRSLKVTGCAL